MRIEQKGKINVSNTSQGETIETKVRRIIANNEPIKNEFEMIYQKESYYVNPDCDPRTDSREVAIMAMDKANMARKAKRDGNTEIGKVLKEEDNGTETNENAV